MRVRGLLAPPYLSNDLYRYVWDGRVAAAGINPYRYVPADDHLAALRDAAIFPFINRATYAPTIYPPIAESIFFATTRLNDSVGWMKATMVAFDVATVAILLRLLALAGLPLERILIYAWHPLILWEFAGSGHIDAAAVMFVALALWARRRHAGSLAGLFLGCAALVKFFPAVIFPALYRRWDWKMPAAVAAVMVLAYLPFLGVGWGVFGFLPGYVAEEGLRSGSGFFLWHLLNASFPLAHVGVLPYLAFAGAILAGACRLRRLLGSQRRSLHRRGRRARSGVHRAAVAALRLVLCLDRTLPDLRTLRGSALSQRRQPAALPDLRRARSRRHQHAGRGVDLWALRCTGGGRDSMPLGEWEHARLFGRRVSSGRRWGEVDPQRYFAHIEAERGAIAEVEPVCLYLETTNRCNLLCTTCPRTFEDLEPPADMSWELFTSIVDQFPKIARVVLHGVGEPMMVRELPRMIRYLKDRGIYVLFNTNGTLLTPRKGKELIAPASTNCASRSTRRNRAPSRWCAGAICSIASCATCPSFTALQRRIAGAAAPRLSLWLTGLKETLDQLPAFVGWRTTSASREVYLQRLVYFPEGQGSGAPRIGAVREARREQTSRAHPRSRSTREGPLASPSTRRARPSPGRAYGGRTISSPGRCAGARGR